MESIDSEFKQNLNRTKRVRLQQAVNPSGTVMELVLPDHFCFNLPGNPVKGDLIWMQVDQDLVYLALVDAHLMNASTGLLDGTLLVHSVLERVFLEFGKRNVSEMVEMTRALMNEEEDPSLVTELPGILLVCFPAGENFESGVSKLEWAGFQIPLYHVFPNVDHGPAVVMKKYGSYTSASVQSGDMLLHGGDMIYLMTDGYVRQPGGTENEPLGDDTLEGMLKDIAHRTVKDQHQILENYLDIWMEYVALEDDVLMVGLRF